MQTVKVIFIARRTRVGKTAAKIVGSLRSPSAATWNSVRNRSVITTAAARHDSVVLNEPAVSAGPVVAGVAVCVEVEAAAGVEAVAVGVNPILKEK